MAAPTSDVHWSLLCALVRSFNLLTGIGQVTVSVNATGSAKATCILLRGSQRSGRACLASDSRPLLGSLRSEALVEAKLSLAISEAVLGRSWRSLNRVRSGLYYKIFERMFKLR